MNNEIKDELVSFLKEVKSKTIELSTELTYINGTGELIYATDIETDTIIFANKNITDIFGNIVGKKCHEALHGFISTCEFCTNSKIISTVGVPYKWIFKNTKINKLFFIVDICKIVNNRYIRIEKAYEIDESIINQFAISK